MENEGLKPVDNEEEVKEVDVLVTVKVRKTISDEEAADRVRFFLESESDWVKEVKSKLYKETFYVFPGTDIGIKVDEETGFGSTIKEPDIMEKIIKQYISSLPEYYGRTLSENETYLMAIERLIERVHKDAYLLGRFEGKQAYHLVQFKDELDIAINDLGVVILEMVVASPTKTLEKYNEVVRLLKEIREELKDKK